MSTQEPRRRQRLADKLAEFNPSSENDRHSTGSERTGTRQQQQPPREHRKVAAVDRSLFRPFVAGPTLQTVPAAGAQNKQNEGVGGGMEVGRKLFEKMASGNKDEEKGKANVIWPKPAAQDELADLLGLNSNPIPLSDGEEESEGGDHATLFGAELEALGDVDNYLHTIDDVAKKGPAAGTEETGRGKSRTKKHEYKSFYAKPKDSENEDEDGVNPGAKPATKAAPSTTAASGMLIDPKPLFKTVVDNAGGPHLRSPILLPRTTIKPQQPKLQPGQKAPEQSEAPKQKQAHGDAVRDIMKGYSLATRPTVPSTGSIAPRATTGLLLPIATSPPGHGQQPSGQKQVAPVVTREPPAQVPKTVATKLPSSVQKPAEATQRTITQILYNPTGNTPNAAKLTPTPTVSNTTAAPSPNVPKPGSSENDDMRASITQMGVQMKEIVEMFKQFMPSIISNNSAATQTAQLNKEATKTTPAETPGNVYNPSATPFVPSKDNTRSVPNQNAGSKEVEEKDNRDILALRKHVGIVERELDSAPEATKGKADLEYMLVAMEKRMDALEQKQMLNSGNTTGKINDMQRRMVNFEQRLDRLAEQMDGAVPAARFY